MANEEMLSSDTHDDVVDLSDTNPEPDATDFDSENGVQHHEGGGKEYESPEVEEGPLTKEEILQKLQVAKTLEDVKTQIKALLENMESRFRSLIVNLVGESNRGYDGIIDESNPRTIFEKEYFNLMNELENLQRSMEIDGNEINLLNLNDNLAEQLVNIQNSAEVMLKEDFNDGTLSNKEISDYHTVISAWRESGIDLFWLHDNMNQFNEWIKNAGDLPLFATAFSIDSGSGAFRDSYKEILRRLGTKNLFTKIDEITSDAQYDSSKDWTRECLQRVVLEGLLKRGKIDDLSKWLDGYQKKDELLQTIKNLFIEGDSAFIFSFLSHLDLIKKSNVLSDLITVLEETNPTIKTLVEEKENIRNKKIDVFSSGNLKGLSLFDDEGHGGGADYFNDSISRYKQQGFTQVGAEETDSMKKIILKKKNDEMTFVLLKKPQGGEGELNHEDFDQQLRYKNTIRNLKDNDYNVFALRGHCYSTSPMACALGELGMVEEGDVLVDGGCWNYSEVGNYFNAGVKGEVFAYRGEGRGNSTEYFMSGLMREKNSTRDFGKFLDWVKSQAVGGTSPAARYMGEQLVTSDDVITLYSRLSSNGLVEQTGNVGGTLPS